MVSWAFINNNTKSIEKFEEVQEQEVQDETIYMKQENNLEKESTFCEKGNFYNLKDDKCTPCDINTYNNNDDHRNISCHSHLKIYNDFVKKGNCNAKVSYTKNKDEITELHKKIKDRPLESQDYCNTKKVTSCKKANFLEHTTNNTRENDCLGCPQNTFQPKTNSDPKCKPKKIMKCKNNTQYLKYYNSRDRDNQCTPCPTGKLANKNFSACVDDKAHLRLVHISNQLKSAKSITISQDDINNMLYHKLSIFR